MVLITQLLDGHAQPRMVQISLLLIQQRVLRDLFLDLRLLISSRTRLNLLILIIVDCEPMGSETQEQDVLWLKL